MSLVVPTVLRELMVLFVLVALVSYFYEIQLLLGNNEENDMYMFLCIGDC